MKILAVTFLRIICYIVELKNRVAISGYYK